MISKLKYKKDRWKIIWVQIQINSERLGLEAVRVKLQAMSNASTGPKVIMTVTAALLVMILNSYLNKTEDEKHVETVGLLRKHQGNFVRANDGYSQ